MIQTLADGVLRGGYDMLAGSERRSESISSAYAGSATYESLTFGSPTYTGRSVTPHSSLTYIPVWACVKILAGLAATPLLTYKNLSPDGLQKRLAVEDYRYRMLREEPNDEMSSMQWREFGIASLSLWGNWYNWLEWDGRGRLQGIWPMRPDWVMPMRSPRTGRIEYRYQSAYAVDRVPSGVYDPWQILHVAGLGWDGVMGYSPITMCRNAVALGQAYEEQGGRFVAGGGSQKVALVTTGTVKDPAKLRAEWNKNNAGLSNAGDIAILHSGLDIKTFGIPPKDAQFLEGRSWQLAETARMMGVPLGLLNDVLAKPETFASAEQADIRVVRYTYRPLATLIEQGINRTVLRSNDALTCEHDLSDLTRGDMLSQATALGTLTDKGILTRNEARVKIKEAPVTDDPEADKLTVQMQMVPLANIGQQPKPTTPQKPPVEPQADPEETQK